MENLLVVIFLLLVGGIFSGLIAGMLGVGGGAVMVPVLFEIFQRMGVDKAHCYHLAIGTSLLIMIPTAIKSFHSHYKTGVVDGRLLKRWFVPILIGVGLGSLTASFVSGSNLRFIFAIIALILGLQILFKKNNFIFAENFPKFPVTEMLGTAIGGISTVMGIGGGTFSNMFFTLYNRSMHQSVATSSGVGVLISFPATIGLALAGLNQSGLPAYSLGYLNFLAAAIVLPVSIAMAPIGARIAHSIPASRLKKFFGCFLIVVSIRFFFTLLA